MLCKQLLAAYGQNWRSGGPHPWTLAVAGWQGLSPCGRQRQIPPNTNRQDPGRGKCGLRLRLDFQPRPVAVRCPAFGVEGSTPVSMVRRKLSLPFFVKRTSSNRREFSKATVVCEPKASSSCSSSSVKTPYS